MKSHLISELDSFGVWAETLCGKMLNDANLIRLRGAKKCKKCKRLLKKEWYCEG